MAKGHKHQMAAGALCRGGHIKSVVLSRWVSLRCWLTVTAKQRAHL